MIILIATEMGESPLYLAAQTLGLGQSMDIEGLGFRVLRGSAVPVPTLLGCSSVGTCLCNFVMSSFFGGRDCV